MRSGITRKDKDTKMAVERNERVVVAPSPSGCNRRNRENKRVSAAGRRCLIGNAGPIAVAIISLLCLIGLDARTTNNVTGVKGSDRRTNGILLRVSSEPVHHDNSVEFAGNSGASNLPWHGGPLLTSPSHVKKDFKREQMSDATGSHPAAPHYLGRRSLDHGGGGGEGTVLDRIIEGGGKSPSQPPLPPPVDGKASAPPQGQGSAGSKNKGEVSVNTDVGASNVGSGDNSGVCPSPSNSPQQPAITPSEPTNPVGHGGNPLDEQQPSPPPVDRKSVV